jgi:hypothetical protein
MKRSRTPEAALPALLPAPLLAPLWGLSLCHLDCGRRAYSWRLDLCEAVCGQHSRGFLCVPLEKPAPLSRSERAAKAARLRDAAAAVFSLHLLGLKPSRQGQVFFTRIVKQWCKQWDLPLQEGLWRIYPNAKPENAAGTHLPELSPKCMGPVRDARTRGCSIENAHQGSKIFAWEVGADGEPTEPALKFREHFWQDPKPHRHKFGTAEMARAMKGRSCTKNNCAQYSFF